MKLKEMWERFTFLLWKDNSFKGWIFSLIFIFVFIKFIFFPFLSLVSGTALPLAIVESCSMYHQGDLLSDFDSWWDRQSGKYNQFEIDKNEFDSFRFQKGLNKGDILFITGVSPERVNVGDIVIFNANTQNPIIHRVVEIKFEDGEYYFSTIGDNNHGQLAFEKKIHEDNLVGRATLKITPYIGWIKLIFFEGGREHSQRGFCEEN